MEVFNPQELKQLYQPAFNSNGEDNGQVTIVGGSKLFHGAPILALKAASRIVDMVFFTSPEPGQNSVISSIMLLNRLIRRRPDILELDINPLIVNEENAFVVDARMVLEM